jgi:hypothetical protein
MVVLGGPTQRREELGTDRGDGIERRADGLELRGGLRRRSRMLDDDADALAAPERPADTTSRFISPRIPKRAGGSTIRGSISSKGR